WGWRGRIGKIENAKGERVDELGPLPELEICCDRRKVFVVFDANCASSVNVREARNALVRELVKRNADVHVVELPASEGINGPDDYIGVRGDKAFSELMESASPAISNWRSLLIRREVRGGSPQPERLLANALI